MMHYSYLNEKIQSLMKVTCYLFICMEKELKKTLTILIKNYLVKMIIMIKR